MLTEQDINACVDSVKYPDDYIGIAHAIIAAYTAKLLAEVEMPEEFNVYTEDETNSVIHGFTEDQLQSYAAAVAAQAREKALDEAIRAVNSGILGHGECAAAIESLKGG